MGSYGETRGDWSDAEMAAWERAHVCAVCARLGEHPGEVTGNTAGDVAPACAAHVGWCGECGTLWGKGPCDACCEAAATATMVERVGTPVLDADALPCGWSYTYPCGAYAEYASPCVNIDVVGHCAHCARLVTAYHSTLIPPAGPTVVGCAAPPAPFVGADIVQTSVETVRPARVA